MALDPALIDALNQAAEEIGQPPAVALRLKAWLTGLSDGDLTHEGQAGFYESLRSALVLGASDAD